MHPLMIECSITRGDEIVGNDISFECQRSGNRLISEKNLFDLKDLNWMKFGGD